MELFWELADLGVRVLFVAALAEGWVYVARLRLLIVEEGVSREAACRAVRVVRHRLSP